MRWKFIAGLQTEKDWYVKHEWGTISMLQSVVGEVSSLGL